MNGPSSPALEMALAAWAWASKQRAHFGIEEDAGDPAIIRQLKPVSELALLAQIAARSGLELDPPASEIAQFCWDELGRGELPARMLAGYPDLFALVSTYAGLSELGFECRRFEETARALAPTRGITGLEFPAWRELDVASSLALLGLAWPRSREAIYRRTWLASRPEPWLLSEGSAYSLTHTVFYMTDFGRRPEGLPRAARSYLQLWLPAWCEFYRTVGNFDLLAEMLMVASCIGFDPDQCPDALRSLAGAQRPDGSVPGPVEPPSGSALTREQLALASFWADYHTTLVACLAGLMIHIARPARS